VQILEEDFTWLDTGTHDSLIEASKFVQNFEQNHNLKIACLEEISYQKNWISRDLFLKNAHKLKNSPYGAYLLNIAEL
jgi:glucose-1-phosphate thymidylyltransferase